MLISKKNSTDRGTGFKLSRFFAGRKALTFGLILLLLFPQFVDLPAIALPQAQAASPNIVISQVYGGGGNAGSTYKNDFIELFNRSTTAATINGWSIQYASAAGTFGTGTNTVTALPDITLQPGQYYLVQEAQGTAGTDNLPAPDFAPNPAINFSATAGKVALVNSVTPLACGSSAAQCSALQIANIVDLIGYGATTGNPGFEGPNPAPALTNTTSAVRVVNGCIDTDNNANNFVIGNPPLTARNTTTTPFVDCTGNQPIVPNCGAASLTTSQGLAATRPISAIDFDGIASFAVLSSSPGPLPGGISLTNINSGVVTGDKLTATLNVDTTVPQAIYNTTITFNNNDTPSQTATCNIAITITAAGPSITPIYTIQGSGAVSPLVGQTVTTVGRVTGFSGTSFFIQDATGDGNINTSDGIYVFKSSFALPATLSLGDEVQVKGGVAEYFNLTELSLASNYSPALTILTEGSVADLPAAIEVNPPADPALSKTYLETLEGMRVKITGAATVTGPTNKFWEYFVVNPASAVTRPFQRDNQNGLPIGVGDDSGPSVRLVVKSGDTVSGLVGPLDYTFSAFKIQPQSNALPTVTAVGPTIPNQVAGAGVTGNQFSVASFNTENFFDDLNDPNTSDTVYSTLDYNNKSAKVARAINDNLSRPTIVGLQEIENTAVLGKAFSEPIFAGVNYGYLLGAATDGRGIKVAFAYRTDKVSINNSYSYQCYTVGSTTAALSNDNATFSCTIFPTASIPATPSGQVALFSRAPLAVVATVQPGGAAGPFLQAVFIVNHLKSKASGPASDPDSTIRRKNEGEELAKLVTNIVADGQPNVLMLGDLNDYENSPMVTGITSGTGSSQLQNLTPLVAAPDRYSYVFSGTSQVLDHILATPGFFSLYKAGSAVFARFNSDFPYYRDTTGPTTSLSITSDANGVSDHNPPLAVFDISTTIGCNITKVVSSSDDGTGTSCGTLSYALKNAAANQTIGFQLGLTEIKPSAALPAFNSGVKLDGGCTVDAATGRGVPGVRLNGASIVGTPTVGLTLVGDNTINGLSIVGYSDYALDISGSGNTLTCSWLGTADGITKQANAGGIRFKNTAGSNNIGLVGDKKSGNLISGNISYGVLDSATSGSANRFYYNLIGYDKAGAFSLRNGKGLKGSGGSRFSFGPGNRISN